MDIIIIGRIAIILLVSVGLFVPGTLQRSAYLKVGLVVAVIAWIAWGGGRNSQTFPAATTHETTTPTPTPKPTSEKKRSVMPAMAADTRRSSLFAPIDAEMYGLRVPSPLDARSIPTPHLLRRSKSLLRVIRRAIRIGTLNGSSAAAIRLVSALEDFFLRVDDAYERTPSLEPLSRMTFETLRDGRSVALSALQEIGLAVPEVRASPIRDAERVVLSETTRAMRLLRDRLIASTGDRTSAYARSISVSASAAGCDSSPVPFDDHDDIDRRTVHV